MALVGTISVCSEHGRNVLAARKGPYDLIAATIVRATSPRPRVGRSGARGLAADTLPIDDLPPSSGHSWTGEARRNSRLLPPVATPRNCPREESRGWINIAAY